MFSMSMEKRRWLTKPTPLDFEGMGKDIRRCKQYLKTEEAEKNIKENFRLKQRIIKLEYEWEHLTQMQNKLCRNKTIGSNVQLHKRIWEQEEGLKKIGSVKRSIQRKIEEHEMKVNSKNCMIQKERKYQNKLEQKHKQVKDKSEELGIIRRQKLKIIQIEEKSIASAIKQYENSMISNQISSEKTRQLIKHLKNQIQHLRTSIQEHQQSYQHKQSQINQLYHTIQLKRNQLKQHHNQIRIFITKLDYDRGLNKELKDKNMANRLKQEQNKHHNLISCVDEIKSQQATYTKYQQQFEQCLNKWKVWASVEILHAERVLY